MATGYFTYNPSWEFEFPTFKRSSLSIEHGYCIACRLDISVTKGRKTLEKHILCKRHISSLAVNSTTSIGRELEINRQRIDVLAKERGFIPDDQLEDDTALEEPECHLNVAPASLPKKPLPAMTFICPLCSQDLGYKNVLTEHLYVTHKQKEIIINRSFISFAAFHVWKSSEEKNSKSYFFKNGKQFKEKRNMVQLYTCYKNKPRKRKSKKGSANVTLFCPAEIKLMVDTEDNSFHVEYRPNHLGHNPEDEPATVADDFITLSDSDNDDEPLDSSSSEDSDDCFTDMSDMYSSEYIGIFDPAKSKKRLLKYAGQLLDKYPNKRSHKQFFKNCLNKFEMDNRKPTSALTTTIVRVPTPK